MTNFIHALNIRCIYKIDRRGGPKSFSRKLPKKYSKRMKKTCLFNVLSFIFYFLFPKMWKIYSIHLWKWVIRAPNDNLLKNFRLRQVNVDHQHVGWYQSAQFGNFLSTSLLESQFCYQTSIEESVCLIFGNIFTHFVYFFFLFLRLLVLIACRIVVRFLFDTWIRGSKSKCQIIDKKLHKKSLMLSKPKSELLKKERLSKIIFLWKGLSFSIEIRQIKEWDCLGTETTLAIFFK